MNPSLKHHLGKNLSRESLEIAPGLGYLHGNIELSARLLLTSEN